MESVQNIWGRVVGYEYFREIAFLFAVLLLLAAWKFGIEGLSD